MERCALHSLVLLSLRFSSASVYPVAFHLCRYAWVLARPKRWHEIQSFAIMTELMAGVSSKLSERKAVKRCDFTVQRHCENLVRDAVLYMLAA